MNQSYLRVIVIYIALLVDIIVIRELLNDSGAFPWHQYAQNFIAHVCRHHKAEQDGKTAPGFRAVFGRVLNH